MVSIHEKNTPTLEYSPTSLPLVFIFGAKNNQEIPFYLSNPKDTSDRRHEQKNKRTNLT